MMHLFFFGREFSQSENMLLNNIHGGVGNQCEETMDVRVIHLQETQRKYPRN